MTKPFYSYKLNPNHKIGQMINSKKSRSNPTAHNSLSYNEHKKIIENIKSKNNPDDTYEKGLKYLNDKKEEIDKLDEDLKIKLYNLIL